MDLKNYSDKELLAKTKNLIREEQKLLSIILSHLEEIERRKLYSDLGYQSLFDYALKELCYTEQQAWRRINAMRVMRKLPELRNQLNDGSLSLSNINMASSLFKDAKINSKEKQLEIFAEIKNTTKQACEEKIFELKSMGYSRPRVKPSLKKLLSIHPECMSIFPAKLFLSWKRSKI